jgi:hypothetical protein
MTIIHGKAGVVRQTINKLFPKPTTAVAAILLTVLSYNKMPWHWFICATTTIATSIYIYDSTAKKHEQYMPDKLTKAILNIKNIIELTLKTTINNPSIDAEFKETAYNLQSLKTKLNSIDDWQNTLVSYIFLVNLSVIWCKSLGAYINFFAATITDGNINLNFRCCVLLAGASMPAMLIRAMLKLSNTPTQFIEQYNCSTHLYERQLTLVAVEMHDINNTDEDYFVSDTPSPYLNN